MDLSSENKALIEEYFIGNPDKKAEITDENAESLINAAKEWKKTNTGENTTAPSKEEKDPKEAPEKQQGTTISEEPQITDQPQDENTGWKEKTLNSWKEWANKNDKDLGVYEDPEHPEFLKFKVFAKGADKEKDAYETDVIYTSQNNVSLKGKDGKVPNIEAMEAAVAAAKSVNGPNISFGNISSPEFKANLMIACLRDPEINMVNAPTAEEIATFPKELQDKIAEAQAARQKNQENDSKTQETKTQSKETKEPETKEQKPELSPTQKRIAELRKQIETRDANIAEAKEAAMAAGGEVRQEDLDAIAKEGMTPEEIKLRELRGLAKNGDKDAAHQLDVRREKMMSDDYKYVREVEMEADGKTEKKDKDGKPVYKKDDKGNYVYKTDDKGNRVESDAYKAFKIRAAQNMSHGK